MRVAIIGSRNYYDYNRMKKFIMSVERGTIFVTGDCRGVDLSVIRVCRCNNIKVEIKGARFDKYGDIAGPIRNAEILNSGIDICVIIVNRPIESCHGSYDMMKQCIVKGIKYRIINV